MKPLVPLAAALAVLGAAALVALPARTAAAQDAAIAAPQPARTISVNGAGTARMTPDIALLSLGVSFDAATPREALDRNNAAMQAVIDALKGLGFGVTDIQTSGLSLTATYDNSSYTPKLTGYRAVNGITLKVKDLARLGEILDLTVTAGANQINGLTFDVADRATALAEARVAAMKDARAKADLMAGALGAVVGRPLSISESYVSDQPVAMQTMNAASASVPIASGEIGLSALVNVVFELN